MSKTFFVLPGVERSTLSCVWFETGNPAQPLACLWIDRDLHIAADHVGSVDDIVPREVRKVDRTDGSSVCTECASGTEPSELLPNRHRQLVADRAADRAPS
jgi:hypothetical protein